MNIKTDYWDTNWLVWMVLWMSSWISKSRVWLYWCDGSRWHRQAKNDRSSSQTGWG